VLEFSMAPKPVGASARPRGFQPFGKTDGTESDRKKGEGQRRWRAKVLHSEPLHNGFRVPHSTFHLRRMTSVQAEPLAARLESRRGAELPAL